ncbi:SF1B family DNA helicase RecD2 [Dellaglioa sp. BT-FLS60]
MVAQKLSLFNDGSQNDDAQAYLVGKVATIFFQSQDSFYKVILIHSVESNLEWPEDEVVVTGNFADIKEEAIYRFYGQQVEHPKYGKQFQASNYQNETPTSKMGLITYLSGAEFKGIGKKTAEAIVDKLGTQTIDKILADDTVLDSLELSNKQKTTLLETVRVNNGMEQIIIGLNGFGFGSQLAATIYQTYKEKTLDIIQENPYQLVNDIENIGFKKADQIAEELGFAADSSGRIQAGILQSINDLCQQDGDTYATAEPLMTASLQLLESSRRVRIEPEAISKELINLAKSGMVVGDEQRIYLKNLYHAEYQIAEHLKRLLSSGKEKAGLAEKDLDKAIRKIEKKLDMNYGASQIDAIKAAMQAQVFLLTGGPGTGKTTVINGIVELFAELNDFSLDINSYGEGQTFPILLAAPTGRAAKRMTETTGLPASTIHRLLGLTGRESTNDVETRDLEGGLLIIDEMSMVDTYLLNTLLNAIPTDMKVILVGDKDQLPSVGPGQTFYDLLKSDYLERKELTDIYRQGDGSSIISLAHSIKKGELPADFTQNQKDRSFFASREYQVESIIKQVVERAKSKGFTSSDIQVLAPMYRGAAGINRLNEMLQDIMNPLENSRQKEVLFRDQKFRIGDKVLHLVNSPENNVFNGDIGKIVGITLAKDSEDKVDELVIAFDQTEVTYRRNEWQKITLAYCTSIHKSQGSEFKMVILPMVSQYKRMLKRNLLYTAITRASELLILLGEERSFEECVENESANRKTTLLLRIEQIFDGDIKKVVEVTEPMQAEKTTTKVEKVVQPMPDVIEKFVLTKTNIMDGSIDPMIGMENVHP